MSNRRFRHDEIHEDDSYNLWGEGLVRYSKLENLPYYSQEDWKENTDYKVPKCYSDKEHTYDGYDSIHTIVEESVSSQSKTYDDILIPQENLTRTLAKSDVATLGSDHAPELTTSELTSTSQTETISDLTYDDTAASNQMGQPTESDIHVSGADNLRRSELLLLPARFNMYLGDIPFNPTMESVNLSTVDNTYETYQSGYDFLNVDEIERNQTVPYELLPREPSAEERDLSTGRTYENLRKN